MKVLGYYFFITLFFISGCDNVVDDNIVEDKNSYDYSIEQKMDCFCAQAGVFVKLYINADTISNAVRMSDNIKLDYNEYRFYKSINELNKLVAEIDTNKYQLIFNYSSDSIYPAYVYINLKPIIVNDTIVTIVADADYSYTTKNHIEYN